MSDKLVTVATFPDYLEAEVGKLKLQSEGIESVIFGETLSTTAWGARAAPYYIELQVRAEDAERASEILRQEGRE